MTAKNVLIGGSLILAIVLIGSLIVTATLNFGGSGSATGLATATISESQAISIASSAAKGAVTEIELENENGKMVYSVEITEGKTEIDVEVDAVTGQILKVEVEDELGRKELDVINPKVTEEQAKNIALKAVNGKITDLEAKKVNGLYVYEIEIQSNGEEADVLVNMMTGKVKSIEREAIDQEDEADREDELEEDESEDVPITGTALDRASAAALRHIGEGRVTDTEIGDEEGYYEIEITTDKGEVDVHLDENFNVLSEEWEDEEDDD